MKEKNIVKARLPKEAYLRLRSGSGAGSHKSKKKYNRKQEKAFLPKERRD